MALLTARAGLRKIPPPSSADLSSQYEYRHNNRNRLVTRFHVLTVGAAIGQQPPDTQVKQAAFSRSASSDAAQQVSFARQAARVGDEIEQNLGLDFRMTMTMRQANEMVGKSQTTVRTNQKRVLTTTEVDNGRIVALRLRYPVATRQESIVEGTETERNRHLRSNPCKGRRTFAGATAATTASWS